MFEMQALVKRNPQLANGAGGSTEASGNAAGPSSSSTGAEHMLTPSLRRRPSSPSLERSQQNRDVAKQAALAKIIGKFAISFFWIELWIILNKCYDFVPLRRSPIQTPDIDSRERKSSYAAFAAFD